MKITYRVEQLDINQVKEILGFCGECGRPIYDKDQYYAVVEENKYCLHCFYVNYQVEVQGVA